MYRFLMGLAVGYLTMTENGKKMTHDLMKRGSQDLNSFLKKEGVIEPSKTTRPPEYSNPSSEPEKQHGTDETINE